MDWGLVGRSVNNQWMNSSAKKSLKAAQGGDGVTTSPAAVPGHGIKLFQSARPAPHLQRHDTEHRRSLQQFLDGIAADYDRIESLLTWGASPGYRRQALLRAGLKPGMQVLDVGCGTGLLARQALAIVGAAGRLVGVDPNPGLMAQARRHEPGRTKALAAATFLVGPAEALPRPDGSANFLSLGYGLHHIENLDLAFAEFRRVLCPGGRLLLLDITRPTRHCTRLALKAYLSAAVPVIARVVGRRADAATLWRYCRDTVEAGISPAEVSAALERAGFSAARHHVKLGMFSEYTATAPSRL